MGWLNQVMKKVSYIGHLVLSSQKQLFKNILNKSSLWFMSVCLSPPKLVLEPSSFWSSLYPSPPIPSTEDLLRVPRAATLWKLLVYQNTLIPIYIAYWRTGIPSDNSILSFEVSSYSTGTCYNILLLPSPPKKRLQQTSPWMSAGGQSHNRGAWDNPNHEDKAGCDYLAFI